MKISPFLFRGKIMNESNCAGPILTTDGIPLKVSLQKSERKNKIRAFLLVTPLYFLYFSHS